MKESLERLINVVNQYKSSFPRLKKELRRLIKEGMETDDIHLIGGACYYLALIGFNQGRRTGFFSNAYKAATMLQGCEESTMVARSLNLLGIAYVAQENYQLALDSYNKALAVIRENKKCRFRRDTVLSNMAECYFQMGEFRRSIKITRDCLKIARKRSPDAYESFTIYGLNLSEYHEAIGEYEEAEAILDEVKPDADKVEPGGVLSSYITRRAVTAYITGDPEKGAEYADMLLEAVGKGFDSYEMHPDFEKLISEELAIGDLARAKRFVDILNDYSLTSGHTIDSITAKRVMAEYRAAAGENEEALKLYTELNELYKKRLREEKAMQFTFRRKVEETDRDVKKLLQKVRISEELAEKDALTGLMNRSALAKKAAEFAESAKAKERMLGGIFIDIDFFKEYNDAYGHAKGDEVIKLVANACIAEKTENVRFARYGGDEFFGLALGKDGAELDAIAARICQRIRGTGAEHAGNPNSKRLTLSVGIVNIDMTDSNNTMIDVINCSDKALYHAKAAGKNAIYAFGRKDNSDPEYRKVDF